MTKQEFLATPGVKEFAKWMAGNLTSDNGFAHSWVAAGHQAAPVVGQRMDFSSIHDAYTKYYWGANSPVTGERLSTYDGHSACLTQLGTALNLAIQNKDAEGCRNYCLKILQWGGVLHRPAIALTIKSQLPNNELPAYLAAIKLWLNREFQPGMPFVYPSETGSHTLNLDSGTTKIYSLLSDQWIIYDGRVGSALGFLVSKWALETEAVVPMPLRFSHANEPHRNPNTSGKRIFPLMKNNNDSRLADNLRANWLLRAVLAEDSRSDFRNMNENSRLRALEAALFMIGYKVK